MTNNKYSHSKYDTQSWAGTVVLPRRAISTPILHTGPARLARLRLTRALSSLIAAGDMDLISDAPTISEPISVQTIAV